MTFLDVLQVAGGIVLILAVAVVGLYVKALLVSKRLTHSGETTTTETEGKTDEN